MELLPDPQNQGERKTEVCLGTNTPKFDEVFGYSVPETDLSNAAFTCNTRSMVYGYSKIDKNYCFILSQNYEF